LGIIFEILARREASFSVARKDYPWKNQQAPIQTWQKTIWF
jgi:hypothetical protein